jgi:hypothetical protein
MKKLDRYLDFLISEIYPLLMKGRLLALVLTLILSAASAIAAPNPKSGAS